MGGSHRIAIANVKEPEYSLLRDCIIGSGNHVAFYANSPAEFIPQSTFASPDILLIGMTNAGDDELESVETYIKQLHLPVVAILSQIDESIVARACASGVLAYVVRPVREVELEAAFFVALQRFSELEELQDKLLRVSQALEDRKLIERAKGIVMTKRSLQEAGAFKFLQQLARRHRQKLVEVAKSIILADEVSEHGS